MSAENNKNLHETWFSPEIRRQMRLVFVVEDDQQVRDSVCQSLIEWGFTPWFPCRNLKQFRSVLKTLGLVGVVGVIYDGNWTYGDRTGNDGRMGFQKTREDYPDMPVIIHSLGLNRNYASKEYGKHLSVNKRRTKMGRDLGRIAYWYFRKHAKWKFWSDDELPVGKEPPKIV